MNARDVYDKSPFYSTFSFKKNIEFIFIHEVCDSPPLFNTIAHVLEKSLLNAVVYSVLILSIKFFNQKLFYNFEGEIDKNIIIDDTIVDTQPEGRQAFKNLPPNRMVDSVFEKEK